MKKTNLLIIAILGLMIWSCGNSKDNSSTKTEITKQTITTENIIGEWQCVDITNGVIHMESIAKMQAHMVFTKDGKILSKMKLPDGTVLDQKIGSYKIENGTIKSELYEINPYMEKDKLIINDLSADNKQIYSKINK